jgi:hypothetical protein
MAKRSAKKPGGDSHSALGDSHSRATARAIDLEALFRFLDDAERQSPMSVSQRVSLARALRPLLKREGRRRQALTGTAPGRRRRRSMSPSFRTRDIIAICVGLAPATLRKAEALIDAANADRRLQFSIKRMDEKYRRFGRAKNVVGVSFREVFRKKTGRSPVRTKRIYDPAFGRALLARFG